MGDPAPAAIPVPGTLFQPEPFSGASTDDLETFLAQITDSLAVNQVHADRHLNFLRLRLKGGALAFIQTEMPADYDAALVLLRGRYINPNRQMLNQMQFGARKFNENFESVEDFVTDLKRLSTTAFAEDEREPRIREAFINGLPNRLKKKVLA